MTEFLPVSSSGHLVFFQSLFGIEEPPVFFDVMLHLGTLLAVVIYFWTDIWKIAQGIGATLKREEKGKLEVNPVRNSSGALNSARPASRSEAGAGIILKCNPASGQRDIISNGVKLFLWIVLATIPTGLMGILFKDWFESLFSKPQWVGGMLLITGLFLWLTRWVNKEGRPPEQMRWFDSIIIGIAQGIAIIPGISRAGSTISTGLFLGLDRELSGKFSFLLSIPAILGATLLEFRKINVGQELWATLIGTAIAFGVGILSLTFLMKIIRVGKLFDFSYYCWGFGVIMIIFTR